jgi:hypothetical protein
MTAGPGGFPTPRTPLSPARSAPVGGTRTVW